MAVIKKYENRRLYDTSASKYVNLDDIARMVEDGEDVTVTDVKTGRDLTRDVLLQIVLESEDGAAALPTSLLRRIIRTRGPDALRRLVREQLALGLEIVEAQLAQSESYVASVASAYTSDPAGESPPMFVHDRPSPPYESGPPVPPFGMPVAAPRQGPSRAPSPERAPDPAWRADPHGQAELDALRQELSKLEARLKR